MDDLIQRVLQGTATDADRESLTAWRRSAPENERRFNEVRRLWELTDRTAARPRRPPPSAAAIIARAQAPGSPTRRPGVRWAALAAAAALVLAGGLWWLRVGPFMPPGEVHAAGDAPLTVTLADGSFAQLSPRSRLEYLAGDSARTVRLTGTAFFAVAHQGGQPFTVESGAARTRVLGTRFEVRQRNDSVRVVVVQGAVSMATRAGAVRLERGEMGQASGATLPTRRAVEDALAEIGGFPPLLYQRTPLAEVAAELARHFDRPIAIADSALVARPVTARFEHERFDDAMTALCLIVRARCALDTTPVRIEP
jgi:transmembrane sensor